MEPSATATSMAGKPKPSAKARSKKPRWRTRLRRALLVCLAIVCVNELVWFGRVFRLRSIAPERTAVMEHRAEVVGEEFTVDQRWVGLGRVVSGGSTITQQLAKNVFLSPTQSYLRKAREAVLAYELELLLSKQRIMELYLNVIEWDEGIYGAEAASEHYLDRPAHTLTRWQAAHLAAIIPGPRNALNPRKHPARHHEARTRILRAMRHVEGI